MNSAVSPFKKGHAVRLLDDYGFFKKGEKGIVEDIDYNMARVGFKTGYYWIPFWGLAHAISDTPTSEPKPPEPELPDTYYAYPSQHSLHGVFYRGERLRWRYAKDILCASISAGVTLEFEQAISMADKLIENLEKTDKR